jgi:lipopolysaccharide biosynthesis regulator YciM
MKAGLVNGKHYTEYVELVRDLKRQGKLDRAEALLLRLITAVEEEAAAGNWIVAPWYYEHLAIVYRKQNDETKELGILKRFASQTHGEAHPLLDRLRKLEAKRR